MPAFAAIWWYNTKTSLKGSRKFLVSYVLGYVLFENYIIVFLPGHRMTKK